MPRQKHYVVFVGRVPGIYESWSECQRKVIRFPGNSYQSYPNRAEEEEAFEAFRQSQMEMFVGGVELQAEMGDEKFSFAGQVEENDTADGQNNYGRATALIIGCIVIMSSLLIKLLW